MRQSKLNTQYFLIGTWLPISHLHPISTLGTYLSAYCFLQSVFQTLTFPPGDGIEMFRDAMQMFNLWTYALLKHERRLGTIYYS
jgi:hypothetical protein